MRSWTCYPARAAYQLFSCGLHYVVRHWRRMLSESKAVLRSALPMSGGSMSCVSFHAPGFHFSGGGGFALGRVGVPAPGRTSGGQNPRVPADGRQGYGLARLHRLNVGAQPGLRQSEAMPPCSLQHSLRKLRAGVPGLLALASTAAYNRSIQSDRLRRPTDFRRCVALALHA